MTAVTLIIIAVGLVVALLAAVLVQQRRTSSRPLDPADSDASAANQRRDDRQGMA